MSAMRLSDVMRRDVAVDPEITGVTADSRQVRPGYLFAALPGAKADGRSFISAALQAGAAAVLADNDVEALTAPVVHAMDLRRAYALAAAAFWGEQPRVCVAVTGTNGKTSVAAFCRQIFTRLGRSAASMGTLGVRAGDEQLTPPGLTTPDAGDVARLLAELAGRGVTHLALEASSHGIDQRRLDGVSLTAAGFLNLTQDHLDYHGSMDSYLAAKLRLFEALLPRAATAVLNADSDAFGAVAATATLSGHTIFSVGQDGQGLQLVGRTPGPAGQRLAILGEGRRFDVDLPLVGAFQASNALVAAGLCIAAGEPVEAVLAALEHIEGAPGRLQRVGAGPRGGEAYVDYAHTPDGLETVLSALRPHARCRLIVVFGAGGDRDRGKRPMMGEIAQRLADVAIVTDDNPRSEDPAAIRAAILAAAPDAREIGDRRAAILAAAAMLADGDVLVVAGKGHEQGQTIAGVTHPFDDVSETAAALGLAPAHG
jgi:UDP-N-acetylmuramoyl-L-alanyl-D-glutamate--2,6-diaminopimelate ligase